MVVDQSPGGRHAALDGATVTIAVGADPTAATPTPHADPDAVRVAVLAGGRSSEHEVSLNSAAAVRAGVAAAGHEVLR